MNPNSLFPQSDKPGQNEPPKTPLALRRKFDKEQVRLNIDNYKIEEIAPVQDADAIRKEQYLEKISAGNAKSKLLSGKLLVLASIAVVMLVAVAIGSILSGGNQVKNASGEVLGQRIINLQSLIKYGSDNKVSGSNVTKVMAETSLVLLSRINDLSPYYNSADGKTNSFTTPSEEIIAQYSTTQLTEKLDKAKSNANLNSVYTESLKSSISEMESLVESLYNDSETADLKTALKKTYDNLAELSSRLPETN
jgi:hypothetical protein